MILDGAKRDRRQHLRPIPTPKTLGTWEFCFCRWDEVGSVSAKSYVGIPHPLRLRKRALIVLSFLKVGIEGV